MARKVLRGLIAMLLCAGCAGPTQQAAVSAGTALPPAEVLATKPTPAATTASLTEVPVARATEVPTARVTVQASKAPTVTPLATPGPAQQLAGQALVDALRGGGYIIFLRHTATDQSQGDSDDLRLLDCTKQRLLNDKGRADAQAIGEAFRRLKIPVGQVLSSKYCRTLDTTRLAFGEAFTPTDDITGFNLAPASQERRRRNEALRTLLSTPPAPDTNLVLVSHQFNLGDVTGLESKEGDTLIFAPGGPAGFSLVARVAVGEWAELATLA